MFTGIIKEVGSIARAVKGSSLTRLGIKSSLCYADARVSDSIAVNGVCLTVTAKENDVLFFDAIGPTLEKTNLRRVKPGDKVNLESAMRSGDKLGGHFVLGHIDCTVRLKRAVKQGQYYRLEIGVPAAYKKFIIENGSVALDGVSLTIKKVTGLSFMAAVVPFTREHTTLKDKRPGSSLNLECDYLLKGRITLR